MPEEPVAGSCGMRSAFLYRPAGDGWCACAGPARRSDWGWAGPAARSLDLAVQDLVGDGLEGGADGAGGDAGEGGSGGVDLGLGGVAGLGEGG
jgi:hypothetical protein